MLGFAEGLILVVGAELREGESEGLWLSVGERLKVGAFETVGFPVGGSDRKGLLLFLGRFLLFDFNPLCLLLIRRAPLANLSDPFIRSESPCRKSLESGWIFELSWLPADLGVSSRSTRIRPSLELRNGSKSEYVILNPSSGSWSVSFSFT